VADLVSLEYKKRVIDYGKGLPNGEKRSFASVQNRFRRLKNPSDPHRWAHHVEKGGTSR